MLGHTYAGTLESRLSSANRPVFTSGSEVELRKNPLFSSTMEASAGEGREGRDDTSLRPRTPRHVDRTKTRDGFSSRLPCAFSLYLLFHVGSRRMGGNQS